MHTGAHRDCDDNTQSMQRFLPEHRKGNGHKVPPLTKKLLANNIFWESSIIRHIPGQCRKDSMCFICLLSCLVLLLCFCLIEFFFLCSVCWGFYVFFFFLKREKEQEIGWGDRWGKSWRSWRRGKNIKIYFMEKKEFREKKNLNLKKRKKT